MQHDIASYRAFIASRATEIHRTGFAPRPISPTAKAHQTAVLDFALNLGKSAAFLDTGLGKSLVGLEYAEQAASHLRNASESTASIFDFLDEGEAA